MEEGVLELTDILKPILEDIHKDLKSRTDEIFFSLNYAEQVNLHFIRFHFRDSRQVYSSYLHTTVAYELTEETFSYINRFNNKIVQYKDSFYFLTVSYPYMYFSNVVRLRKI